MDETNERPRGGHANREPRTSLLWAVQQADPEAWRQLHTLLNPVLFHWCRDRGIDGHEAENICQEVWFTVHRHITTFHRDQPGQSFLAWLWTIANSRIIDHIRQQQDEPRAPGGSDFHQQLQHVAAPHDTSQESFAFSVFYRRVLELAQARFEPQTWQIFWAIVIEDKPAATVAQEFNVTLQVVYTSSHRVRKHVREVLA